MNENEQQLNDEGRELWNQKAEFWDNLHGDEGNRFHRELVSPSVERLLSLQTGEKVLDVGCGNGVLARRLATLGGSVIATDFSPELIELAKKRGQSTGEPIDYRVVDATNEDILAALGEGQFDAVTCTMAMMDMPVIAPLFRAVRRLLKESGRFVFANMHPAFNSNNPIFSQNRLMRMAKLSCLLVSKSKPILTLHQQGVQGQRVNPLRTTTIIVRCSKC